MRAARQYLGIGLLIAVLALATALPAAGYFFKDELHRGLALLRGIGPTVFFLCMSVLPAMGVPLLVFTLSAAPLFAPQLGLPLVMLLALSAVTTNMALGYALAVRVLRPALTRLVRRLGYSLPVVADADAGDLIVLLRVTPGPAFAIQNFLPGLASVPFGRYLLLSCLTALPLNAAIVFFGDSLVQGRGRLALLGVLLVAAVLAALHLIRRHLRARNAVQS
jgi:uncharacterized membrane protein YdjX (TVP38/TMEM64 family)